MVTLHSVVEPVGHAGKSPAGMNYPQIGYHVNQHDLLLFQAPELLKAILHNLKLEFFLWGGGGIAWQAHYTQNCKEHQIEPKASPHKQIIILKLLIM